MRNITFAAIAMIAPALAACGQSQSQPKSAAPAPPQVTVAKPVTRQIAEQDEYVGRFVAIESVEVRARVSGYLDAIHFRDGQIVHKGDLLFTVDRRPFETSLAQAQASLEQARANLAFADADLKRAQNVAVGSVVSIWTVRLFVASWLPALSRAKYESVVSPSLETGTVAVAAFTVAPPL